jgi:hypothetical protein
VLVYRGSMAEIEALLTGATDVQLSAALDGLPGTAVPVELRPAPAHIVA